jgi:hypothetical protein
MNFLDVLIMVAIVTGCALALPIFAWLFVTPLRQLFKKGRADKPQSSETSFSPE